MSTYEYVEQKVKIGVHSANPPPLFVGGAKWNFQYWRYLGGWDILASQGGVDYIGWGWFSQGGAFPMNRIDWIRFHNTFSKQLLLATYSEIILNFFSSPNVIYKMSSSTRNRRTGIEYSEANLSDEIELINNHLLKILRLSGGLKLSNLGWGCQCRVG